MLERFQEVDRHLCGAAAPQTAADIEFLWKRGVRSIVSLDGMPFEAAKEVKKLGMQTLELPLDDALPPNKAEVQKFLRFISENIRQGKKVFVHCIHGRGRTRTMLALYLIRKGTHPLLAHSMVGTVETPEQKEFLMEYGKRIETARARPKLVKKSRLLQKPKAPPKRPRK